MTSGGYETGDVARIYMDFLDITGTPIDPTAVTITVTEPGGTTVVYTLAGATVINDPTAVGRFYADHPITKLGTHVGKGVSTGPAAAAITQFVSTG